MEGRRETVQSKEDHSLTGRQNADGLGRKIIPSLCFAARPYLSHELVPIAWYPLLSIKQWIDPEPIDLMLSYDNQPTVDPASAA
jgi:hypothetical protein